MSRNQSETEFVERFSLRWRIQHIVLMVSFLILAATGFALRYEDSWFGTLMIFLEGGFQSRGILHRTFALVTIGLMLYHLYYIIFSEEGHKEIMKHKPRRQDFKNLLQSLKLLLGIDSQVPAYGKYTAAQKFQYLGVVAGLIIMIITGLILWFETAAMFILPLWMFQITLAVHGDEGLLIFLILFLWHMYNVHLNPDVFPMSKAWLDGKISLKKMQSDHPEEYREIMNKE